MILKDELKHIKDHFDSLTDKEFKDNLIKAGINNASEYLSQQY